MPVTTPEAFTVAMELEALLQVPPVVASVRVVVLPAHIVPPPVMVPALAAGVTVRATVAATVPQPLVMA